MHLGDTPTPLNASLPPSDGITEDQARADGAERPAQNPPMLRRKRGKGAVGGYVSHNLALAVELEFAALKRRPKRRFYLRTPV
jgi:hypothetical protein